MKMIHSLGGSKMLGLLRVLNFAGVATVAGLLCVETQVQASVLVRTVRYPDGRTKVLSRTVLGASDAKSAKASIVPEVVRSIPKFLPEGAPPSEEIYEEIIYSDAFVPRLPQVARKLSPAAEDSLTTAEVRTLIEQGPPANRINLPILGDGYTLAEKEQFFADAERIRQDLFNADTFQSYVPFFNVYAIFVPSRESGITDLNRKDTAFGLYRNPPGSKRAIYPGDETAIDAAFDLAPGRDYPIIIANDDNYGGLGGQYAISTRSVRSGTIVMRHELGHNFGNVGEEYDAGYVYSGANSSGTPSSAWGQWSTGPITLNRAEYLVGDYLWQDLGRNSYRSRFSVPTGYGLEIFLSTVGWGGAGQVSIKLDGAEIPLVGDYTDDRSFFQWGPNPVSNASAHDLSVDELVHDGNNVLASAAVYAYPPGYDFTPEKVAGFATYNNFHMMVGYRPTHDACLMRNMLSRHFCPIDQENMWLRFLRKVDLIDVASVASDGTLSVTSLPVSGLTNSWSKWDGTSWQPHTGPAITRGRYRAEVRLATPEIRKADPRLARTREVIF